MKTAELAKILNATFGHLSDEQILALTLYGEARGEPHEGRIAVGSVILERVDHRDWDGKTIQEVCLKPYQFSCFLPSDPNFAKLKAIAEDWEHGLLDSAPLQKCHAVAKGLLNGVIPRDPVIAAHHCTQYCAIDAQPDWKKTMRLIGTVSRHEFYA